MPAAPRLVCPAVATFLWRQQDRGKHQLFLSFGAEDGAPVVGLRMGSSWSGWHGYWKRTPKSLTVWVSWCGNTITTRIFLEVGGKDSLYHFVQHGEVIWVNFAGIFTKTISQRLLLDGECSLGGAIVSLPETHKWLDSIYVPPVFFGWMVIEVIDLKKLE